jgi:hypothetical protein
MWRLHRRSYELVSAGEERKQAFYTYRHLALLTRSKAEAVELLDGIPSFVVLQSEKFQNDNYRVKGSYTGEASQCRIV